MNENRSTTSNENNNTAYQSNVNNDQSDHELPEVNCRPGLKLPKTPTQWKEANLYFHHAFFDNLNTNAVIGDLNNMSYRFKIKSMIILRHHVVLLKKSLSLIYTINMKTFQ